jgi:spore coat protein JB
MTPEREALLRQITILDFTTVDLQLYLNTHPQDKEALEMYNSAAQESQAAKNIYEQQFGPLTGFRSEGGTSWSWINEPWPWQEEYNFSLIKGGLSHVGV